jgi:hypothetical protein
MKSAENSGSVGNKKASLGRKLALHVNDINVMR